jgi:DNA repair protein RecO (recombination protein O)
MSYNLYSTEAIVLAYENKGEANRIVTLLTEEFGLIRAMVQSVREVRSKQRFGLQIFTLVQVNLIQGKEFWRLAGVEPKENLGMRLAENMHAYAIVVRASSLIRRLVQGQEKNEELFAEIRHALRFLIQQSLDQETSQYFETLLILRILYHLGYWSNINEAPWLVDAELSQEVLEQTAVNHTNLIERINTSLQETQL